MNYTKLTQKHKLLAQHQPLAKDLVCNLNDWFRIELTYNSNAIEGNTLTRQETSLIVEKGITVGGKTLNEHLEATNHAHALDLINAKVNSKPQHITEDDILEIHRIILKGIDDNNAGCYRNVRVRISGSLVVLPNPLKVPILMREFSEWLKQKHTLHPVELAAEAHYRLVTIHPFTDGNGRTARLLMNMILLLHGYPMTIIRASERLAYINALEKAQLGEAKDDYFKLIANAVDRSFEIYFKAINNNDDENEQINSIKLLKIGELAKKTGENNSTIRHWSKKGLLDVTETTKSGYQLYDVTMIERIKIIHKLKKQRYTLQEIRQKLNDSKKSS